jgi:hypothetical protein
MECYDYPYYSTLDVRFYGSMPLLKFWPDLELSENNLPQTIFLLRQALGDRRKDRALLLLGVGVGRVGDQTVEHRLVETDLLGRHRAVVELVDAVGQLGGHHRFALGTPEHQDPVEGPQGRLALAGHLGDAMLELTARRKIVSKDGST